MRLACCSSTWSIASNSAGIDLSPFALAAFQRGEHLVPEQRGEQEARRHRPVLAHALVGAAEGEVEEAVAERLLDDHVEQRQHPVVEAVLAQRAHRLQRMARQQQLLHLVEQPGCGHVLDQRRELGDRRRGLGLDGDAELGGQPDRAQHPHRVLAIPGHRGADQAQPPGADVGDAADVVPHRLVGGVEVQRVDGEIAPRRILGVRAVHVVGNEAAVLVGRVLAGLRRAERRHFQRLGADVDVDQPEAPPDDEGPPEQRLHLLGRGVGRDVEVLGHDAQRQVAHGAADDVRLVAGVLQLAGDLERAAGQLVAAYRVVVRAVDALARGLRARHQAGDEAADHRIGASAEWRGTPATADVARGRRRGPAGAEWRGGRKMGGVIERGQMVARGPRRASSTRPARGRRSTRGRSPGG